MSTVSALESSATKPQSSKGFGAMDSDEFMRIIFTELQNQDPLAPSDTNSLLQQLSTIRSIESDMNMTAKLDRFVQQNEVISATALVGKFVAAKGQFGTDEVGYVDSVMLTVQGPMLNLSNGAQVPFDRVTEIIDPDLIGAAPQKPGQPSTGEPATNPEPSDQDEQPETPASDEDEPNGE
jgi:flagellar basal-body rod modification protein FlgD